MMQWPIFISKPNMLQKVPNHPKQLRIKHLQKHSWHLSFALHGLERFKSSYSSLSSYCTWLLSIRLPHVYQTTPTHPYYKPESPLTASTFIEATFVHGQIPTKALLSVEVSLIRPSQGHWITSIEPFFVLKWLNHEWLNHFTHELPIWGQILTRFFF